MPLRFARYRPRRRAGTIEGQPNFIAATTRDDYSRNVLQPAFLARSTPVQELNKIRLSVSKKLHDAVLIQKPSSQQELSTRKFNEF